MCRPRFYGIEYEINPWMNKERGADHDRALEQWQTLVGILEELGASIELIEPVRGLPDMVFTANAGIVYRDLQGLVASLEAGGEDLVRAGLLPAPLD